MKHAWAGILVVVLLVFPGLALDRVTGSWELTLEIAPTLQIYGSELHLSFTLAGWEIESETKFYSGPVFKYQNFYLDGYLGGWDVWGKIYFSAEEARYQKLWLDFEKALGEATLFFSVNHWASQDDYFASDKNRFGPWPCDTVTWDTLLPWDQEHEDRFKYEYMHVQGPVVSFYPNTPSTYVTLNVGAPWPNDRFMVYITGEAFTTLQDRLGDTFWEDLVGKTICVYGKIIEYSNLPEIGLYDAEDADDLAVGPCCGTPNALGPLMIYRGELTWEPLTLTVDFADCCTGIHFQKLTASLSGLSLCCGLSYDASLSFSKCHGFESLTFTVGDVYLPCCDITGEIEVEFTVDGKSISFTPTWQGISSCIDLYGDVHWDSAANIIDRLEIYGVGITCYFGDVTLTAVGALDPDAVKDMTEYSFYSGEFEYLAWEWEGAGCCGGDMYFSAEFWFGSDGLLFGIQRTKYTLAVPLTEDISFTLKGQWDFSDPSPLDYFDVVLSVEF